jgi:hypothetical protein
MERPQDGKVADNGVFILNVTQHQAVPLQHPLRDAFHTVLDL